MGIHGKNLSRVIQDWLLAFLFLELFDEATILFPQAFAEPLGTETAALVRRRRRRRRCRHPRDFNEAYGL